MSDAAAATIMLSVIVISICVLVGWALWLTRDK